MKSTVIARTALATALAAAATLGAVAAPATAAPAHAVTGNGSGSYAGPQVTLSHYGDEHWDKYAQVGPFTPVQPGRPVKLDLNFAIGGKNSTYSDLHFATSNPGTAAGCHMYDMYTSGGATTCVVTLPAMKPGQTGTYWVTMTGKRDGKPFSVTASTRLWAADVRVGAYVNGKWASGQKVSVPRTGKVTVAYVVDNKTTWTLTNVESGNRQGVRCSVPKIAPWGYGVCSFTVTGEEIARQRGGFRLEGVYPHFGTAVNHFTTVPTTVVVAS